ncbi:aspartate 1-decarboxylase precursor [Parvularcula bermudensis HTCC2503]|uniref:Aspartate 1-decarboxylase n=1 Tax=Parvularcula bermudensis (strain ATCC BAA-594 / HTCC2503 / KCTC 12087) TaxID=314260 RepID=E0TCT9_PARBH|nr:aspartate 1-decarboxylase [Parvularcula bermudensis]ADM09878.1 aspartate 1-decarboxylase precursor [Parvularcula bermudensis HTCC2503]
MLLTLLKAKIHGATLTMTDLHYEGSIAIDEDLLEASGILPYEQVDIWNVTNGARLSTYAMAGQRGSGQLLLNGAAARLAHVGDRVIISAFAQFEADEVERHRPSIVLVNPDNSVKSIL